MQLSHFRRILKINQHSFNFDAAKFSAARIGQPEIMRGGFSDSISPQDCQVVRIPKFLSIPEIQKVFDVQEIYRSKFAEPVPKRPFWVTTYLSSRTDSTPGGLLQSLEPELFQKIIQLKNFIDPTIFKITTETKQNQLKCDDIDKLQVRCIELHVYGPGGGLGDPKHFDGGSMITVDIMLDDMFQGGSFQTPEIENNNSIMKSSLFELGDALIFPSLKYHQVDQITHGSRKVLVLEFWKGVERHCDHRCPTPFGDCSFKREDVPSFHPPFDQGYYD